METVLLFGKIALGRVGETVVTGWCCRYAKDRMTDGPVFGSKDMFSGLAIIADTYSNHNGPHNHNHPYLSAMVNNGSLSYDHDRDGTHTMLGGCEVKLRNMEHETVIAIRYEGDKLTVSHDLDNKREWEPCFSIGKIFLINIAFKHFKS